MCLDCLKKFKVPKIGYKVIFQDVKDSSWYPLCVYDTRKPLILGEWLEEEDYRPDYTKEDIGIMITPFESYPFGWHTFQSFEGARRWRGTPKGTAIIVRVEIEDVVATGIQVMWSKLRRHCFQVIVSKKIKILEEVKDGNTRSKG